MTVKILIDLAAEDAPSAAALLFGFADELASRTTADRPVAAPATAPPKPSKPRTEPKAPEPATTTPPPPAPTPAPDPQGAVWDAASEALAQQALEAPPAPTAASGGPSKDSLRALADKVTKVAQLVGQAGIKAVMAPYGPLSKWPIEEWGRLNSQLDAVLAGGQS